MPTQMETGEERPCFFASCQIPYYGLIATSPQPSLCHQRLFKTCPFLLFTKPIIGHNFAAKFYTHTHTHRESQEQRKQRMLWAWKKEQLDLILVPCGLVILFSYHLFLLHRYLKCPQTTQIGCENHDKRAWVNRVMQLDFDKRSLAISVLGDQISASTSLSSISLVLSSLIGALIGNSYNDFLKAGFIYGDTKPTTNSVKHICILSFFLLAFACFVQTTRHLVHCSFLMSNPISQDIPVSLVEKAMIRGSNFWLVGLRALYFAMTLLMWIFGPIPMLASSVVMVIVLHTLDRNSTPLIQYRHSEGTRVLRKIGEELTAMAEAIHHDERERT